MGKPNFPFERRLGVVPVLFGGKKTRVVLVSRSSGDGFTFPKGNTAPNVNKIQQASIEAFEEAGLIGRISAKPVGTLTYTQHQRLILIRFYPFIVEQLLKDWPEQDNRERLIVTRKSAASLLDDDSAMLIKTSLRWIQENHLTMKQALPNAEQILKNWPVKKWLD